MIPSATLGILAAKSVPVLIGLENVYFQKIFGNGFTITSSAARLLSTKQTQDHAKPATSAKRS